MCSGERRGAKCRRRDSRLIGLSGIGKIALPVCQDERRGRIAITRAHCRRIVDRHAEDGNDGSGYDQVDARHSRSRICNIE
jgi:hypothetical protein